MRPPRSAASSSTPWAIHRPKATRSSFGETVIRVERMEDLGVAEVSLQFGEPGVPRVEEWEVGDDE
jgi:hypothetical protein